MTIRSLEQAENEEEIAWEAYLATTRSIAHMTLAESAPHHRLAKKALDRARARLRYHRRKAGLLYAGSTERTIAK